MPTTEWIGGGGRSSTGAAFRARRGGDDDGTSCGGGSRGVAPFYRVGEVVEGSGGGQPVRWVLTPPVLKVLKAGGGDSTGSRLDEGRGRGGSVAQLLVERQRARCITAEVGRMGGGSASDRRREMTSDVGQAGPNDLVTPAGMEKF
jgi:hypothetical protein